MVRTGIETFWKVGKALADIRDGRLYRESHGTFEDYCRERWDITDNYARRLIGSAEVRANLETVPIGTVPENEAQSRPLASLPPELQRAAWTEAAEATNASPRRRT